MKLAVFLPSLRGGGAERAVLTLANGFASRGYTVDLVLVSAEGPYLKEISPSVRVVDLKAVRVSSSLLKLVRYLRREQPIALLSAMSHANVIAVLARLLARVATRIVVSERANFSVARANATSLRRRMMGFFMRFAYPYSAGVVAISSGVADDLANSIGIPRESISVVYNPVLVDSILAHGEIRPDHPWFRPHESPVIIGVGRLVPQKDFHSLIRAFARLRKTRQARLLILGEGVLRRELEMLSMQLGLQDVVSIPGFLDNPFAYVKNSAVFVLSSAWEGFGNVLVEAMVCGTPVVSTACPSGPGEILENGRWGRLVSVGDVEALAEAMAATLDEREHPDVAARAAEFGIDRAMDGYLRVMLPEEYEVRKLP